MPKIVPIVEGDGEVEAVPILLRQLLDAAQRWDIQIARPKNADGCANLIKPDGLERFLQLAWREPDCAAVLVLLDADKECPRTLAESFVARIKAIGTGYTVAIVIAKCEYEAWFLASLESIVASGKTALPIGLEYSGEVETRRGVKEWLSAQMPRERSYNETRDQAAMTNWIDHELAQQHSRSFRGLCHAVEEILEAFDTGTVMVTPDLGSPV